MNSRRYEMTDGRTLAFCTLPENELVSLFQSLEVSGQKGGHLPGFTYTRFHRNVLRRHRMLPLMERHEALTKVADALDTRAHWYVVVTSLASTAAPWSRGIPWVASEAEPGTEGLKLPGTLCLERTYRAVAREVFHRDCGGAQRFFQALNRLRRAPTLDALTSEILSLVQAEPQEAELPLVAPETVRAQAQAIGLAQLAGAHWVS